MAAMGVEEREHLRRLPLFSGLSAEDLDQLLGMARRLDLRPGATLMTEGEAGEEMFLVLDGELEVSKRQRGVEDLVAKRGAGEVVGEMAVLEMVPRSATVRAISAARLLVIDRSAFNQLLSCSASAGAAILRTVVARLRDTEAVLMQREKLAALGTMAAGLAHELNNPAAALKRSSAELKGALEARDRAAAALLGPGLAQAELAAMSRLAELTAARMAGRGQAGAGSSDPGREDRLLALLEGLGIGRAWEATAALAEAGWDRTELEPELTAFAAEHRAALLSWLAADASCRALLDEINIGTSAISALVGAVKEYSYMDRAPFNVVDVHDGLESTLTILRHRLGAVEVARDYDRSLPRIEAHGSELNQVWTNLIDNALGAMGGAGVLRVGTRGNGDQVTVEIEDSGPGIDEATLPRLFEPFFTTKAVGEGTGLGLHIVWNVVVLRHGGQLAVSSSPGSTVFKVTLPRVQAGKAGAGDGSPP